MAQCVSCGKSSWFLRVDDRYKMCKVCLAKEMERQDKERKAMEILTWMNIIKESMDKTNNFKQYMGYYDSILSHLKKGALIEENISHFEKIYGSFKDDYKRILQEKQWHMRDAIESEYNEIVKNSKGIYKNNREKTNECCYEFIQSIEEYRYQFDDETAAFAYKYVRKISLKFNLDTDIEIPAEYCTENDFDKLSGIEFEYWCANVLHKNGFEQIEVSKESGDQGVDIIAEKEGVRYAIQCMRYSTTIGNKPVQEIAAGKLFYKCHVGVVMTNNYFTRSAKELAIATGILLWDRDVIIRMNSKTEKKESPDDIGKSDLNNDSEFLVAVDFALELGQISISMLQSKMHISYERARFIIDEMSRRGIVSEADGNKPRCILITREQANDMFESYL